MTDKPRCNLARALGLTQGILMAMDMETFNKVGLKTVLEEIEKLLTEIMESDDR